MCIWKFPQTLSSKESACDAKDAGDLGSIPGWGRSPGGGHGNPLQFSCLENPMDRGAWRATVCRVTKSRPRLKGLSIHPSECFRLPLLPKPNSMPHLHIWSRNISSASFLCYNGIWCFLKPRLIQALKNARYPCHLSLAEPSSHLAPSTCPSYHGATAQLCTFQTRDPTLVN